MNSLVAFFALVIFLLVSCYMLVKIVTYFNNGKYSYLSIDKEIDNENNPA